MDDLSNRAGYVLIVIGEISPDQPCSLEAVQASTWFRGRQLVEAAQGAAELRSRGLVQHLWGDVYELTAAGRALVS